MSRTAAALALTVLLGGCAPAARETPRATMGPPAAPAPDAAYEVLLARAKAHPPDVDFGALRMAYAHSPQYQPYTVYPDQRAPMRQALQAEDWRRVLEIAQSALELNYVRMRPHLHAMRAHHALGDAPAAAYHRAMIDGLARSITASGDGRSPETAMIVIDVQEEYDVLGILGLRSVQQGLLRRAGRALDQHTVIAPDGARFSMYFDVSLPLSRSPVR
jgi:hypothetical protein